MRLTINAEKMYEKCLASQSFERKKEGVRATERFLSGVPQPPPPWRLLSGHFCWIAKGRRSIRVVTLRQIADFLALRRNTALLMIALVLAGTGERLWLGFAPKYLQTLGAG